MAILLAETLITLGAALKRWCHLQKTWMPFTDAITFQPAVVPVVGIGVIKSFSYPCCHWIGVDIPECIQHPSVVFGGNRSGVIPCLPEVPATPSKAVECHRLIPTNPVHQAGQLGSIIRSDEQVQVICHQTHRIQPVRDFCLCFGEHCQQHIPPQTFGNQKLTAIAPERNMKGRAIRQGSPWAGHAILQSTSYYGA